MRAHVARWLLLAQCAGLSSESIGIYSLQASGNASGTRRHLLGGWRSDDLAQSCAPVVLARSLAGLDRPLPLRVLTDSAATAADAPNLRDSSGDWSRNASGNPPDGEIPFDDAFGGSLPPMVGRGYANLRDEESGR